MPETCWRSWNSSYETKQKARSDSGPSGLVQRRLLAGVLEDVLGEVIFDTGVVVQSLVICGFEQLLAALTKLFANVLLHAWVGDFALASLLLRNELDDLVPGSDLPRP